MGILIKAYKRIVYQRRKTNSNLQIILYHLLFVISCVPVKTWYNLLSIIAEVNEIIACIILIALIPTIPIALIIGSSSLLNYLFEIVELSKEKYKTITFVTISLVLDLSSILIAVQHSIMPIAFGFWVIQGLIIIALIVLKIEE